jgi:hypothetical protein
MYADGEGAIYAQTASGAMYADGEGSPIHGERAGVVNAHSAQRPALSAQRPAQRTREARWHACRLPRASRSACGQRVMGDGPLTTRGPGRVALGSGPQPTTAKENS